MNYVFLWRNYGLNHHHLVQIIMSVIMFIYGRYYVLLCFNYVLIMFYYAWTTEHDWSTPPSTSLDRTFGLGAGLNQNLVQIKTEVNQGIGPREPIPGSTRFFIAICTPEPPESCQMRWTTVRHFEPVEPIWTTPELPLSHIWTIFEP